MNKVIINPGHHPIYDSGAVNRNSGLREADVALDIAKLVKKYLEDAGVRVYMIQSNSLEAIADSANNIDADIFVSIHCNACENHNARGTETLVYSHYSEGAELAQYIQDQIIENIHTKDRGVKERPGLYVIRHTKMPAALVETAFIDNDEDARLLVTYKDDFASCIARGITDYFTKGKWN